MKGERGVLQTEVTHKAEIIDIAEQKEGQLVNTVRSHKSNQPNMDFIIKITAKGVEELNSLNINSDSEKAYNMQQQGP